MANNNRSPVVRQINRELLSCGICLGQYRRPKVLPCLHTFCQNCLASYVPPHSLAVTCPVCRQPSILPLEGVAGLQTNFFVTNLMDVVACGGSSGCTSSTCEVEDARAVSKCLDCDIFLCDLCTDLHCSMEVGVERGEEEDDEVVGILSTPHTVVGVDQISGTTDSDETPHLVCPSHFGNSLQYYCTQCETAVCADCTDIEHIGHAHISLRDAIEQQKCELLKLVAQVRDQAPVVEDSITLVTDVSKALEKRSHEVEQQISNAFNELSKAMDERKNSLLGELSDAFSAKQGVLNEQKEALESFLDKMQTSCDFTAESLNHGNETEILLLKKEMSQKLEELAMAKPQFLPEQNDFLVFDDTALQSLKKSLCGLGALHTNSAVAHETIASGEGLRQCYAGRPCVVTVTAKDRNGDLVKCGYAPVTALVTADGSEDQVHPTVTDHRNGTYDVTYTLKTEGRYQLDLMMFAQHIKGSPFKVKCVAGGEEADTLSGTSKIPRTAAVKQKGTKRPSSSRSHGSTNRRSNPIEDDLLFKVGIKGRNKGEFTNPQGLCCTTGRVLVADSNNQVVQVFSNTGECRLRFGSAGRVAGKIQRPTGVAVTLNGNYLVADYDNKWVSVFAPDGKYLNKIGTGRLQGPKGVAVDNNGHIIVVDNKASAVLVFQNNGKLLHKFGSRGNDDTQFAGPHYAAITKDNDIVITDFHNHCVKVFDSEGSFVFTFGSNGEGNGQFNAPTGVAVDPNGNILVADWGNSRIQVFDKNGSFLSYVNTSAEPLYGPQGLAITSDGQVVVADSGNHCIKFYRYLQ
ncbi:tripartite motif-containing protein 2-like [Littorina saxatilis]|uniref:Tripartite motif-containing protein 2-like n=1 Tax=Littorina saxatilis TaxID=31220 RepID=A0AAN9B164_9CAEN